jgi:hypothetical protein
MLLSLKGHLVPARSARNRSIAHSGNMYFILVVVCTLLVQMPNGKHSVKFVMGAIVALQCMPVFHYFIDIIVRSYMWAKVEKLCGHFYGPVWDLRLL